MSVTFSLVPASPIAGVTTNSKHADFYVYEWVICETGEIFYVGKGRRSRAKAYHSNNESAERIRREHETEIVFLATNLTENEALLLEAQEIMRIQKETPWILTNVAVPEGCSSAWSPSKSTPPLSFEMSPEIYSTDVDEHYFDTFGRNFDSVELSALKSVYIEERMLQPGIISSIYGNRYATYRDEVVEALKRRGVKILATKYAKSVSAWIYSGDLSLWLYRDDQAKAVDRIGREVRTLHLIDVWKALEAPAGDNDFSLENDTLDAKA